MRKLLVFLFPLFLLADFIEINTQKILEKHNELRAKYFKRIKL